MYYNIYQKDFEVSAGIPNDEIKWYDIEGQPFGSAIHFNVIAFENGVNIVDIQGAAAIGENFISSRGLSVGFGKGATLAGTGYSPDLVRFMVGNNVTVDGTLTVVGNVVVGNEFFAESGSTYLIGKNFTPNQEEELERLYAANGGSEYWRPANKGNYFAISSYDVPRFIPASKIGADLSAYFRDARASINNFKSCIEELPDNGEVLDNFHEWLLEGTDSNQNVFTIDATENRGVIDKGIRTMVPESSITIVRIRTGSKAYIRYGLWGDKEKVSQMLYVFEDANDIYMDVPAAIWGSILAPQAIYHGHTTGGTVSGNAAVRGFEVEPTSGFEFHWYPFIGGVICGRDEVILPAIPMPKIEEPQMIDEVPRQDIPRQQEPLQQAPILEKPPQIVAPKFDIKVPRSAPISKVVPEMNITPRVEVMPEMTVMPEIEFVSKTTPVIEKDEPVAFERIGTEFGVKLEYGIKEETPERSRCNKERSYSSILNETEDLIEPGMIRGMISGCYCCKPHCWRLCLYKVRSGERVLVDEERLSFTEKFEFVADESCSYVLQIISECQDMGISRCKPKVTFFNVGIVELQIEI